MADLVIESSTIAPPDWPNISTEILCPLCSYNLRGLIEPRCPECGYRFTWAEILDPLRRLHPYLFEHHPERGFRAYWRTAIGGWWPGRFWRTLSPLQLIVPARLARYAFDSFVLMMLPMVVLAARLATDSTLGTGKADFALMTPWRNYAWPGASFWLVEILSLPRVCSAIIAAMLMPTQRLDGFIITVALGTTCWATLTFWLLMIFQQSMGKAGIRRAHVARCVIYSFDAMIWPTALFALALAMQSAEYPYFDAYEPIVSTAGIAVLVTIPLIVYRLARAYQRYLRFDHALAVVASVQLIVLLIVLVLAAGYYWVNYS